MLIVRFSGGLGNQIFQYAFYRYIQDVFPDVEIKADISNYQEGKIHNGFELEKIFKINKIKYANNFDILKVKSYIPYNYHYIGEKIYNRIVNIINRKLKKKPDQFITKLTVSKWEKSFPEDKKIDYYFDGCYWQIPKYFEYNLDNLLSELEFKDTIDSVNTKIAEEISNCNSVSVHVRRGDYVNNSFDIISSKYYINAIEKLQSIAICDKFYIFSDDPAYAESLFKNLSNKLIISHNSGNNSYKDLFLMSLCKNNIIANSSFSTCAALLNKNNKKIIISPDRLSSENGLDIMPKFSFSNWIQIKAE